jgi:beta-mannosidase
MPPLPPVKIDLLARTWRLRGWRPFAWQLSYSMELRSELHNDVPPLTATVPGSAHTALLAAGWIQDWNRGLDSLLCEWVEHRHWDFTTEIASGEIAAGQRVALLAEGLDYSGWILVDGKTAATFKGALVPHTIDLTTQLADGRAHTLALIFDTPPPEQGQIGFTSKSTFFKPRNNYSWDWCPRMVPVGIWDSLALQVGEPVAELTRLSALLNDNLSIGKVIATISTQRDGVATTIRLLRDGTEVTALDTQLTAGENRIELEVHDVALWWPATHGQQALYEVHVAAGGMPVAQRRVGFRRLRWLPCEGAPAGADPWICEINGKPIFLQVVNWTPIRLDYHATTGDDYRRRISLYREMGCNLLRVWGGAYPEREIFFDLCDGAGLLVWQEFPLSSSGIDNWPPEEPQAIDDLCGIGRAMVRRRRHHACLALWCGGNELQHAPGRKDGIGIPVTLDHPCIAALTRLVAEEDPGTRFLPTSSSGPRFMAAQADFGKGLHHDVHGPWNLESELTAWEKYWTADDSLFRSETGMPGAAPLALILHYCGDANPWPPNATNPYWLHTGAWWLQWDRFRAELEGLSGPEGLKRYVTLSQDLQAQALTIAARACRDRFPRCGGFLLWMGHDSFPCPVNTSIIDFDGNPKPAYHALKEIFTGKLQP